MINIVVKEEGNTIWYFGEEEQRRRQGIDRARIFELLITPWMDSTESIPCENQFRRGTDSREGGGDPRTKSIPALKIDIL